MNRWQLVPLSESQVHPAGRVVRENSVAFKSTDLSASVSCRFRRIRTSINQNTKYFGVRVVHGDKHQNGSAISNHCVWVGFCCKQCVDDFHILVAVCSKHQRRKPIRTPKMDVGSRMFVVA